ncbi:MAG: anthranilate synthase component I [Chloroflexota bacterium]|nr:anthranilate synthase component I [Chloroflexota bacterium]
MMATLAKSAISNRELQPVIRDLPADVDTPISVYLKLRGLGSSFLLESVEGGEHLARYSMIGTQPRAILRSWGDRVVLEEEGRWEEFALGEEDILDVLRAYLPTYASDRQGGLPRFTGGAVGYMGYDLVRSFERLPESAPDTLELPEAVFLISDRLVIYDHARHCLLAIAHADPSDTGSVREAEAALDEMVARLKRPLPTPRASARDASETEEKEFTSAFSREEFEGAVRKTKEYIAAGDIFQAVISRRIHRGTEAQPLDVYRALRRVNPSPYMFYLELPDGLRLIGSSPEVLVRLDRGTAETRPLAGTRRRGETVEEDEDLAKELLADPKERAEHVMLVDLARNDLGRVCRFGTVSTPTMMEIERYSHVMHIVSEVRGELEDSKDAFDLLRACFPAGTVSGAPKVRAMEIIEELEPERRGPYAGAVGYFGFSGNMDTCITIRTIVMQGKEVYLQAGAGIVADSDPAREFEETNNKLRALSQALLLAERGEL